MNPTAAKDEDINSVAGNPIINENNPSHEPAVVVGIAINNNTNDGEFSDGNSQATTPKKKKHRSTFKKIKRLVKRANHRYQTFMIPRYRLYLRTFMVLALVVVSAVNISRDIKARQHIAIAFGAMAVMKVACLAVLLRVGYKPLAQQIEEYEEGPSPSSSDSKNEKGKDNNNSNSDDVDYLAQRHTSAESNTSLRTISKDSDSNNDTHDKKDAPLLVSDNDDDGRGLVPIGDSSPSPPFAYTPYSQAIQDPRHPISRSFFRRHPKAVIGGFIFGGVVSTGAGIYYLIQAAEEGEEFAMNTLIDTTWMAAILYLACVKWFVIIVLLMQRLRREAAEFATGTLFDPKPPRPYDSDLDEDE